MVTDVPGGTQWRSEGSSSTPGSPCGIGGKSRVPWVWKEDTQGTEHGLVWTQEQATGLNAQRVSLELLIHASVEAVRIVPAPQGPHQGKH